MNSSGPYDDDADGKAGTGGTARKEWMGSLPSRSKGAARGSPDASDSVATQRKAAHGAPRQEQAEARLQTERRKDSAGRGSRTDPVAAVVFEFNSRYFVVNEDGSSIIWRKSRDPMLNDRIYYQRSKSRIYAHSI